MQFKSLEEAQAKYDELEVEVSKLRDQIKNQNSYITKLEAGNKGGQPAPTTGNPVVQKYLEKNMLKDTINEAKEAIIASVGQDVYNAVEPDFKAFLDKNLRIENCTVEFVSDAFSLVYGKCYRNKDHALHTVLGKATNPQPGTPNPIDITNTNADTNPNVLRNNPPIITSNDGTPSPAPSPEGQPKSKRDIFKGFEQRLRQGGAQNPFQ